MPRPKRDVRASGVGRSLGASRGLLRCLGCGRNQPREAIAYISRTKIPDGPLAGHFSIYCGECLRISRFHPDDRRVAEAKLVVRDEVRKILDELGRTP